MKLNVLLHSSVFRGDHEAETVEAHELREGETVEQLVERVIPLNGRTPFLNHIEIRRSQEPTQTPPSGGRVSE